MVESSHEVGRGDGQVEGDEPADRHRLVTSTAPCSIATKQGRAYVCCDLRPSPAHPSPGGTLPPIYT